MIEIIVDILQLDDFYGESENIDIAKGKYKMVEGLQEGRSQYKREKAWQRQ